jgi:hypothetical protein
MTIYTIEFLYGNDMRMGYDNYYWKHLFYFETEEGRKIYTEKNKHTFTKVHRFNQIEVLP